MTKLEAIAFFMDMDECTHGGSEPIQMAIEALKQEPCEDEIILTKEEYGQLFSDAFGNGYAKGYREALEQDSILDQIKAEIKEWYWQADKQALAKDPCVVDAMIDLFIRTIDKYKAGGK